jgi:hypothetical protein
MGDGVISRRGGGSGAAMNIMTVAKAWLLPASAKEDTLAVVGVSPDTIYVQEAIPDGTDFDIWVTPEDKVYDINLAKKGSLLIGIGNVFQFMDGQWSEVDAYIFRDGKWQYVWNKVLYENGKVTGKVEHFDMLSPSTCKVTYGESYIQFVTKAGSASEAYAVFGPIDLTDMTTLTANGNYPKAMDTTIYSVMGVADNAEASFTDSDTEGEYTVKNTVKGNKAGQTFELQLDVSALTGEWYIYIGTNTAGGKWSNARTVNFTALKGA